MIPGLGFLPSVWEVQMDPDPFIAGIWGVNQRIEDLVFPLCHFVFQINKCISKKKLLNSSGSWHEGVVVKTWRESCAS